MTELKEYFNVKVSKYIEGSELEIVRPASLNNPKDNAVMFITKGHIAEADAFLKCKDCLVFWPKDVEVPENIKERHAVVPCASPHNSYCRFFAENGITYLQPIDDYNLVGGAYIAKTASIGEDCTIFPGVYIGGEVTIGDHVYIGSGVKLVGEVHIGNNVVIRENTVLGADGLSTDRDENGAAITMPQFGSIVIGDDVQIGANTTIARGAIDETRIKRGAKIDSCTFISHNVTVGEDSFVVGETIMFGSSSVGERALISGNSTLMNMVHIGDGSIVGAGAVVTKSVEAGRIVKGNPAK